MAVRAQLQLSLGVPWAACFVPSPGSSRHTCVPAQQPKSTSCLNEVPVGILPLKATSPVGTLHPNCQDSSGRPRRDIGTILQILNDLLSATRHYQGMPPSLTQLRCHAQCSSASPAPDLAPKTTSCEKLAAVPPASLLQGQSQIRMCKPPGECPLSRPLCVLVGTGSS